MNLKKLVGSSAKVLTGQVLWAFSQAAVLIFLSSRGEEQIVATIIYSLSIFTPLNLLFSLNLRNLIGIGELTDRFYRAAEKLRLCTSVASAFATVIATSYLYQPAQTYHIAMIGILLARIADQQADLYIGIDQRQRHISSIFRSYVVRGLANSIPFFLVIQVGGSYSYALVLAASFSLAAVGSIAIARRRASEYDSHKTLPQLIESLRNKSSTKTALFPTIDSLHLNSYRYAVSIYLSASTLATVGIAQTLLTPLQMVVTALGVTQVVSFNESNFAQNTKKNSKATQLRIIIIAFIASLIFVVGAKIAPDFFIRAVFHANLQVSQKILVLTSLVMTAWAISAITSQTLLLTGMHAQYSINATIGITAFWAGIGYIYLINNGIVDITHICTVLSGSYVVRLLHASFIYHSK